MNISVFQHFWQVLISSARVRLAISPLLHLPWTTTRRTPKMGPGAKGELRKAWIKAERNKENMQTQSYFLEPQIFSMIPVFQKKTKLTLLVWPSKSMWFTHPTLHCILTLRLFWLSNFNPPEAPISTLSMFFLFARAPCHKWIVMATEII